MSLTLFQVIAKQTLGPNLEPTWIPLVPIIVHLQSMNQLVEQLYWWYVGKDVWQNNIPSIYNYLYPISFRSIHCYIFISTISLTLLYRKTRSLNTWIYLWFSNCWIKTANYGFIIFEVYCTLVYSNPVVQYTSYYVGLHYQIPTFLFIFPKKSILHNIESL